MSEKKLTVRILQNKGSVYEAIQYAKTFSPDYPEEPTKPHLPSKHTFDEAAAYAESLKIYEAEYEQYRVVKDAYKQSIDEINAIVVEYIKTEAGLKSLPPKTQEKVWNRAWMHHSGGYEQVYEELQSLVDLFED
jgi:hypothetical protein